MHKCSFSMSNYLRNWSEKFFELVFQMDAKDWGIIIFGINGSERIYPRGISIKWNCRSNGPTGVLICWDDFRIFQNTYLYILKYVHIWNNKKYLKNIQEMLLWATKSRHCLYNTVIFCCLSSNTLERVVSSTRINCTQTIYQVVWALLTTVGSQALTQIA